MDSSAIAQQQKPAAFWIYTGFLVSELLAIIGFVSTTAFVVSLVLFLLVGIWAHVERGRDSMLDTHYQFQIRTFWINVAASVGTLLISMVGLAGSVAAIVTNHDGGAGVATGVMGMIGLGIVLTLIWLASTIWTVARSVVGLKCLNEGRAIANPTTWFV